LVGRVYCTFREWCVDQYLRRKKGGVPRGEKTQIVDDHWKRKKGKLEKGVPRGVEVPDIHVSGMPCVFESGFGAWAYFPLLEWSSSSCLSEDD
jgi:hypothetical protein